MTLKPLEGSMHCLQLVPPGWSLAGSVVQGPELVDTRLTPVDAYSFLLQGVNVEHVN